MKMRHRQCLKCKNEWDSPVELSQFTANLSGELTQYCPDCNSGEIVSFPAYEPYEGFAITQGKGFRITFANGWTASVQFGSGNYCEQRDLSSNYLTRLDDPDDRGFHSSRDAEIAAFTENDGQKAKWHIFPGDEDNETSVRGWCKPAEVLAFLNEVASKPKED